MLIQHHSTALHKFSNLVASNVDLSAANSLKLDVWGREELFSTARLRSLRVCSLYYLLLVSSRLLIISNHWRSMGIKRVSGSVSTSMMTSLTRANVIWILAKATSVPMLARVSLPLAVCQTWAYLHRLSSRGISLAFLDIGWKTSRAELRLDETKRDELDR